MADNVLAPECSQSRAFAYLFILIALPFLYSRLKQKPDQR